MILDTNALSAWADGLASLDPHLRSIDRLVVPSVVLGEYYFGIRQSRYRKRYEDWLRHSLPLVEIATITRETANIYADIRINLKRCGRPIPPNDVWIAALALQHAFPILSNDTHFDAVTDIRRIPF